MPREPFSVTESLWVRGAAIDAQRNARCESEGIRAYGAEVFMFKGPEDKDGLARLKSLLVKQDRHVILSRLATSDLRPLYPLLRERRNFSLVVDDWWNMPHWFMRSARYIIFRNYNGIAARLGKTTLVPGTQPPLLFNPSGSFNNYTALAAGLRLPALASWPAVAVYDAIRRRLEPPDPGRYLYWPFPIDAANVPLGSEVLKYDFANTGGTCGIWFIRDPYASFRYTFTNLYRDRERLTDVIAGFEGKPYSFYDCRREVKFVIPYDDYIRKNRQSRFLVATGGLHYSSVPKFLEYVCIGTPMIGSLLPFEYPWLEECLMPVNAIALEANELKQRLDQALDRYPVFHANCLKWREPLLELYNIHRLLDMLQDQAHGKPVPPGYLIDKQDSNGLTR